MKEEFMESKDKPITIPEEYYINDIKFEKDVLYIDTRENDDTLDAFRSFLNENTIKEKSGWNKQFGDEKYCRVKLTGNRYLPYKTWKIAKLPVGDFMYNGIIFELKRGYDLYDSITGEIARLDIQIDAAKKGIRNNEIKDYQVFCTMEGDFIGDKFNEFNYFSNQEGLIPIQYYGIDECIKGMFNVWNSSTKLKMLRTNHIPKHNPAYLQLYALDSCSRKKAEDIYYHFHVFSLEDLKKITLTGLMEIKGIGPKNALKIYNELQEVIYGPKEVEHKIKFEGEVHVY